ncbi:hypothetical protein CHARACLAT_012306 [Characodon lateralis]|uniref:Secreted protein n=1 Tax=Characodon lateralis TaxID=208331 RepID=A0ABU7E0M2_9TELE|nr:hypothetical protein [Characodon lateralis]
MIYLSCLISLSFLDLLVRTAAILSALPVHPPSTNIFWKILLAQHASLSVSESMVCAPFPGPTIIFFKVLP